ncbi:MAG: DegV family EDD domain-containing protein [Clostridia bacterium]|nr:DegV family EDD domain-containing protein [Clostridia bacterium]
MSVIFASSTCDLNLKILKKVGVEVLNLPVNFNGKKCLYNASKFNFDEYYANSNIALDEPNYTKLIKTKFTEALLTGQDLIYLTANAKYDLTYKFVNPILKELATKFPEQKIEIVNCNNYSLGYGLIVYEAGIVNSRGESITEVTKFVNKIKRQIKTYIIPSTNANIKQKLTLVGGMIGVRPVLEVVGGELKVLNNVRGKKNIINVLLEKAKQNSNEVPLAIMCGKNTDEANALEEYVLEADSERVILKGGINPLMLSQFGDRTIAISYYKKPRS